MQEMYDGAFMTDAKDLPQKLQLNLSAFEEEGMDLDESIADYLSERFGYCMNNFNYTINRKKDKINITSIDWDLSE